MGYFFADNPPAGNPADSAPIPELASLAEFKASPSPCGVTGEQMALMRELWSNAVADLLAAKHPDKPREMLVAVAAHFFRTKGHLDPEVAAKCIAFKKIDLGDA